MAGVIEEAESKLREILREAAPQLPVVSVQVTPRSDSEGDPSLYLTVVLEREPREEDFEVVRRARRQLRNWLSDEKGDERYPYFTLASIQEQQQADGS